MKPGEVFVDNFLAHYASEYYDPAKAREYYLRTRELKNKRSVSDLTVKYQEKSKSKGKKNKGKMVTKVNQAATDRKKQAWAYAKNQLDEEKKARTEAASARRKEVVDNARRSTQARRKEIGSKLTALLELLTNTRTKDAEALEAKEDADLAKADERRAERSRRVRENAQRAIAAIPEIPEGVRGPARERLVAARNKRIDRINGDAAREIGVIRTEAATEREAISADADKKRVALSEQTATKKESGRDTASANRKRVARELKATVEKARADYEAGKERLIAEYEAKSQKEFDAIRTRV